MKRTKITEDGHWIWQGAANQKTHHGLVTVNGHLRYLHRFIFCLVHELSYHDDFYACHKQECSRPRCWNPDHIYKGNNSTNVNDMVELKTHVEARKTHCPRGHEYDKENTRIAFNGKRICLACRRQRDRNRIRFTRNGRRITVPGTRKL
jgi:hypothetical protein